MLSITQVYRSECPSATVSTPAFYFTAIIKTKLTEEWQNGCLTDLISSSVIEFISLGQAAEIRRGIALCWDFIRLCWSQQDIPIAEFHPMMRKSETGIA